VPATIEKRDTVQCAMHFQKAMNRLEGKTHHPPLTSEFYVLFPRHSNTVNLHRRIDFPYVEANGFFDSGRKSGSLTPC